MVMRSTDHGSRARILSEISERLAKRTGISKWYELSLSIEKLFRQEFKKRKERKYILMLIFYSPSVYYLMGIEPDLFTSIFAVSRISGWCAHIIEEKYAQAQPKPAI